MGIMSLLTAFQPSASAYSSNPMSDFWYSPVSSPTASGVSVTPDTAMQLSAVWACVSLISDTVASLPLHLYRRVGDDRERATDNHLYSILHDRPNDWQTAVEYRQFKMVSALLRGNSYSYKLLDDRGELDQLLPLHPDAVTVEKIRTGTARGGLPLYGLRYQVRMLDGTITTMLADEIHHVRGLSVDGYVGVSVIDYARQSFGLAIATEEHGARFFGNGARPGGIMSPKGSLPQAELDRLKAGWNSVFQGVANSNKVAVLPVDVTYTPIGVTNNDSQFLQSREFQIREISRTFRVPLHMIGETTRESSFGTGIEQMSVGFVIYCLRAWLVREEQAISRDLITDPDLYAEHSVDGLLRGDAKSRAESLQIARQNGIINGDAWARIENLPVPDDGAGKAYWKPMNFGNIGEERPTSNTFTAPPAKAPNAAHLMLLTANVERVIRRESARVLDIAKKTASDPAKWHQELDAYYGEHADYVSGALFLAHDTAATYCGEQVTALKRGGIAVMDEWPVTRVKALVGLAMIEHSEVTT